MKGGLNGGYPSLSVVREMSPSRPRICHCVVNKSTRARSWTQCNAKSIRLRTPTWVRNSFSVQGESAFQRVDQPCTLSRPFPLHSVGRQARIPSTQVWQVRSRKSEQTRTMVQDAPLSRCKVRDEKRPGESRRAAIRSQRRHLDRTLLIFASLTGRRNDSCPYS